jgi:hypothetical protein
MVNSVVVPDTEDRSLCRLMAVGRGDGFISVYDIDSKPAPLTSSAASGGSTITSSSKKAGGKAKAKQKGGSRAGGSSSGGGGAAAGAREGSSLAGREGVAAAEPSSSGDATAGTGAAGRTAAATSAAAEEAAWRVPFVPGRVCLLGREQGGHTAAVNSLEFVHGTNWQRLLSAGNDGRLVLWDWQAAAARQGSGWRGPEAGKREAQAGQPGLSVGGDFVAEEGQEGQQTPAAAAAAAGAGQGAPVVVADVKHGRKVNWVCTCEPVGGYNIFLADVTRRMTALALQ